MNPVAQAMTVYRVALAAGHDQRTAIRAARVATNRLAQDVHVGGFEVWKGIKTPTQIRDEINRIDGEVKSTGSDLATTEAIHLHDESGHDITAFMDSVWDPFIQAWSKFHAEHQSFLSNMWGTTWDQAQDYQRQLVAIREKAKGLGIALRSADPITPKPNAFEEIAKAIWSLVKIIIYVALIIGGVVVLRRFT